MSRSSKVRGCLMLYFCCLQSLTTLKSRIKSSLQRNNYFELRAYMNFLWEKRILFDNIIFIFHQTSLTYCQSVSLFLQVWCVENSGTMPGTQSGHLCREKQIVENLVSEENSVRNVSGYHCVLVSLTSSKRKLGQDQACAPLTVANHQ